MTVGSEDPNLSAGVAAVDRALSIVAAIEASSMPLGLSEISRRTGLYKSTILRLMISLEKAGYISRLSGARYALGPTIWRLGHAYERVNPFKTHIDPLLHDLVEKGTESASFHVRNTADSRLCLLRVDSNHPTLDGVKAGMILPLHGAAGRILSAFEGGYSSLGGERIFISYGERDPSCAGIATPVFGVDGRLEGALSLSGPRERFTEQHVGEMSRLLIKAGEMATKALSGISM